MMRTNSKLIVSLIKRIEVRLPINNTGKTLESLEQDQNTQQTAAAIIETSSYKLPIVVNQLALVLESISKNVQQATHSSTDTYIPFDVLQSQLFLLKLLSACLQHHWTQYRKQQKELQTEQQQQPFLDSNQAIDTSSNISTSTTQRTKTSDELDPPALDETLVNFLLSLLSKFLCQMHVIEERNEQLANLSTEYPNEAMAYASKADPQTLDVIKEVYSTAGKILHYLSASNWSAYYSKIKNAVNILSAVSESSDLNPPEIRILSFASLNVAKLHIILTELSPYFLNMKIQGKLLFAKMIRIAIWKWIETKPSQFAEICASNSRPLAGSEILFDMCNVAADNLRKKAILWPLQTILLSLSPDILLHAFLDERSVQNRRSGFPRQLRKALEASRTQEIAAICYVDLCKAATHISPEEDTILRHIAADVDDILREKVWNFSRAVTIDTLTTSQGFTISYQALVIDYILSTIRLDHVRFFQTSLPSLVQEDTPSVFKLAFISACLTIVQEENTMPWNPTIDTLYSSISSALRRIFIQTVKIELSTPTSRSDISSATSGSRKLGGDKTLINRLQNTASVLQSILRLFRLDPMTALKDTPSSNNVEENGVVITSMIKLLRHPDSRIKRCTTECLLRFHDPTVISHWGPPTSLVANFWKISSQTMLLLARQILDSKQNEDTLNALLDLLSKILNARNLFLAKTLEMSHENTEPHDRIQATMALEVSLLVSLCSPSPNICSLATKCLGLMCIEAKMIDEELESQHSVMSFSHNMEIYEDLSFEEPHVQGLRKQAFVGRKAQQKRVRKYLRMINLPTPGVLNAWEEVWKRWRVLTQVVSRFGMDTLRDLNDIVSSNPAAAKKIGGLVKHDKVKTTSIRAIPVPVARIETDDEKQTEWQNYTGFLAALGGSRLIAEMEDDFVDDKRSKSNDRLASPSQSNFIATKFVTEMVELLTSDSVFVREAVKDALGGDLSPSLYPVLFRNLEITISHLFNPNGEIYSDSNNSLLVEQSVLILKMVLDRLVDPSDCLLNIDFSTLVLKLASYINKLPRGNYTTLRIMILMCHLTEVLMLKKEQVIIRDDVRVRNKLLEIMVEWTSDFNTRSMKQTMNGTSAQNKEVQHDLDQVCLKAIVALLYKLPLKSTEQSRDNDRTQSIPFLKYFTYFTHLLDNCHRFEAELSGNISSTSSIYSSRSKDLRSVVIKPSDSFQYWGPLRDSAVKALSNLLSANVAAGLKTSLAMGYHENPRTRAAFMQVMSNILNEGAEFETLAEDILTDRYEKLVELLVESDIEIALSLCEVCPSGDTSGVAEVLLQCFESNRKVIDLLKSVIDREVSSTEQEATLFRGTNTATKILSIFARETCVNYIRFTLQPALEAINALPEDQLTWEMSPQKICSSEDVLKNKQNVCRATSILLDAICSSTENAPMLFRKELSLIVEAVNRRFPDASKTSVGGFVFLRLFNPTILTPETSGFSKQAIPVSKNVKKLLLQATRMMQNLANNMMFGAKEPHLISLNDFITSNLYKVANFLREISKPPTTLEHDKAGNNKVRMDTIAYTNLHRYMTENLDKISRDLSARRGRSNEDNQKMLEYKRTMDRFSNILAQLGPPSEVAQQELATTRNYAFVNGNKFYSDFMRRNKHRDIGPMSALNIFYQSGVSRANHPVFYFIMRHIKSESFDFELLIYYMLRIMEPYLNQPFELFFDVTAMASDCELPINWLNQFFQLAFSERSDNMVSLYLLNAGFFSQRYARKLPRLLTNKLVKRCRLGISTREFHTWISSSELRLPKETYDIEKETGMTVRNAYFVSNFKNTVQVTLRIGREFLQIITVREQEIFSNLLAVLNSVYRMRDITDIFLPALPPSKKASNDGEIHILYEGGKSTLVLVVPNREEVYKYLWERKQSLDSKKKHEEDGIRPNDVPGRILNLAMLNLGGDDPALRLAAYNLLHSLCISFRFSIAQKLMHASDLCVPFNSTDFAKNISEGLAATEAHLTLEFLSECIVGYKKSSADVSRQLMILEYMVPWLRNLVLFINSPLHKGSTKVKDCIKQLIAITAEKSETYQHIQNSIWKTLGQVEELHDLTIDCMIQYSIENGIGSVQAEFMADTIVTMSSNSIRGKIINRLRRTLQATAQNCRESVVKHQLWSEIGCLTRFLLMLSFYSESLSRPYVAEVFHIISLISSSGPTFIRSSVHELVVNVIHALITDRSIVPENRKKLKYVLDDVCDGKYRVHFGLNKSYANSFTITDETMTDTIETTNLSSLEIIIKLLIESIKYAAPNMDIANVWRARWMSLVTSMAFQFNPALQPRAFVVLGCLAQDEIDDDLLFQILVVLRNELSRFDPTKPKLTISVMMCLTNVIDNLSVDSRYLKPMFWLTVAIIQMNHNEIFPYAIKLLHGILRTLDTHKHFDYRSVEEVLLEARMPISFIAEEIDRKSGLSFKTQFSFALAAILLKGYKIADARDNIFMCLSTFLEIESKNNSTPNTIDSKCLGYLCGLLPFAAKNDVLRELLRLAGITDIEIEETDPQANIYSSIWQLIDIPNNTNGMLLVSFLVLMLNLAENEAERLFLYGFLSKVALSTPAVFALVYDTLIPKMNSIVVSSDNVALIDAVKDILLTACCEPAFCVNEKGSQHKHYLNEIGFPALGENNFGSNDIKPELVSELLHVICE